MAGGGISSRQCSPEAHEHNVGGQTREQGDGNAWCQIVDESLNDFPDLFGAILEHSCNGNERNLVTTPIGGELKLGVPWNTCDRLITAATSWIFSLI